MFLVLCLCFASAFPITAFAEDTGITEGFSGGGMATLRVIATGGDIEALFGATFTVYRASDDEWIAEITTDSGGIAEVELPLGDYCLLQIQTAAGYALAEGRVPFSLSECGDTLELPIQNQRQPEEPPVNGTVRIVKLAEGTDEPLPGAVFGIYRASDGVKVAEISTGSDGSADCGLAPDDYYLIELAAPEGFILDDGKVDFTVQSGETTELTVMNAPVEPETPATGYVQIVKKAEGTNERLSGAVFGIFKDSNNMKVTEITTDSDGSAVYELLPDSYYLLELKAPDGYALQTDKTGFAVTAGETTEITVTNKPEEATTGYISLTKKAEGSGALLPGAVFGIYEDSNDAKVAEITTDSNGAAAYELLPDSYYLQELKAPDGYTLQTDKTGFTITAGETTEVTLTNKPEETATGYISLTKKAEGTGDLLPGAVFGIYRASDNAKITEVTTDSNGAAAYELLPGSYYLRELKAPDGFLAESASIPFSIKEDETVRVEVTDMREKSVAANGGVEIPKTGEPFPTGSYALSTLFLCIAALCGVILWGPHRAARLRGERRSEGA